MRLLHTTDLTFEEYFGTAPQPYAILSHCWFKELPDREVTYQQVLDRRDLDDCAGWQKVLRGCRIAKSRGFEWIWCDTACIDKTNSSELSETINSMYRYYKEAAECYVFLDDVRLSDSGDSGEGKTRIDFQTLGDFLTSRWFTRGWTLQELLAPPKVMFYGKFGDFIGTRSKLAKIICSVTGIQRKYLVQKSKVEEASVARRMSWASGRSTTRSEDLAYSLLGIFDVNMPLLYGEGGTKAFQRLQLAIIEQSDDESIFAWGIDNNTAEPTGMLANSPVDFANSGDVISYPGLRATNGPSFHGTRRGISFTYIPTFTETIMTGLHRHFNMSRQIRLACHRAGAKSLSSIDINIKPGRGRLRRVGLKHKDPHTFADALRRVIGPERTMYIASTLDSIEARPSALSPASESLRWLGTWGCMYLLLENWLRFRFRGLEDKKQTSFLPSLLLSLLLMLVNDTRTSMFSAALLGILLLENFA